MQKVFICLSLAILYFSCKKSDTTPSVNNNVPKCLIKEITSEDTFYMNGSPNEFTTAKEQYTYDVNNNLIEAKTERNSKNTQNVYYRKIISYRQFAYDQSNNVIKAINIDSSIYTGPPGGSAPPIIWFGTTTNYEYSGGKLVKLTKIDTGTQGYATPKKEIMNLHYSGSILSQIMATDDKASTIQYEVNNKGYITKRIVNGLGEMFTYDANGNLTQIDDSNGYRTVFSFDLQQSIEEKQNPQNKGVLKNLYFLSPNNIIKGESFYVSGTNLIYQSGSENSYEYNSSNLPVKALYKSLGSGKQVYFKRNLSFSFTNCN